LKKPDIRVSITKYTRKEKIKERNPIKDGKIYSGHKFENLKYLED
jgi:hypothetical protein